MSRGQIFQTNSGWGFALKYTDGAEAKRIKRQGYGTKAMAEKALREALTTLDSGRAVSSARLTLEKYLLGFEGVGGWLEKYERRQKVKATTLSAVTNHVNAYIVPRLGKVSLGALDTDTLESFYLDLLEGGKKNGEPLNPKTVRNIAGTLQAMPSFLAGKSRNLLSGKNRICSPFLNTPKKYATRCFLFGFWRFLLVFDAVRYSACAGLTLTSITVISS